MFLSKVQQFLYTHNCLIKEKQLHVNLLVISYILMWI